MKLQAKLIMAFGIVVLFMGISQSLYLQSRIETIFQGYVEKHNIGFMERMEQTLELYYEQTGSWDNVQQFFTSNNFSNGQGQGRMMRGMSMNMAMMNNFDILLLGTDGTILADSANTRVGTKGTGLIGSSEDLVINGEKKGTLVLHQNSIQNLEEEFLSSSKTAILISLFIAAALGGIISIWISRKITHPLKKLMVGINRITKGEKVEKVNINTRDEFHELGEAFNDMSHKLERTEDMRQSLVADVAHELRTPLTILQGKLESIQEGAIYPSEKVVLELTDEVYRLNRLVKDLQQLSLAEAGQLPLHKQTIPIKQFIDRVCSNLQWLADEKEITLKHDRIPEGSSVQIDADRMTQVIVNLIGNALRHTPEHGLVEISVREQDGNFIIQVSDSGPGIPADILPYIFERFYKGDPSRTRKESGTGLGLSIAKGFIEAHGGRISVESEPTKGTIFTITLPK